MRAPVRDVLQTKQKEKKEGRKTRSLRYKEGRKIRKIANDDFVSMNLR